MGISVFNQVPFMWYVYLLICTATTFGLSWVLLAIIGCLSPSEWASGMKWWMFIVSFCLIAAIALISVAAYALRLVS